MSCPGRLQWHPIKTLIAPIIGGLSQIGALILLLRNRGALSGAASVPFVKDMPYVVIIVFAGIALAAYYKAKYPERYAGIGRFVYDEHAETPTRLQPSAPPLGRQSRPLQPTLAVEFALSPTPGCFFD